MSNRPVVSSRSSRTKEASRPSYNSTLARSTGKPRLPPPSPAVAAKTVPPRNIVTRTGSVKIVPVATTAGTGGRVTPGMPPKPRPRPAAILGTGDAGESEHDGSDEYEEEDDEAEETESQVKIPKPLSTSPPLASVVTPPMPAVPLQTVFTVSADGDPAAVCIVVKTGIRFTFNYANVSSGKARINRPCDYI